MTCHEVGQSSRCSVDQRNPRFSLPPLWHPKTGQSDHGFGDSVATYATMGRIVCYQIVEVRQDCNPRLNQHPQPCRPRVSRPTFEPRNILNYMRLARSDDDGIVAAAATISTRDERLAEREPAGKAARKNCTLLTASRPG